MPPGASRFLAHRLRDLAWGCGFGALLTPPVVYSLALDEISVSSRLGQPLQAAIPVSASAREALDSACFSVATSSDGSLPGIDGMHLHFDRVTGQLTLRSVRPVREPLSEVTIRVRCNGVPALDRTFLVALDPPALQTESVFARAEATPGDVQSGADEASTFAPAADMSATRARAVSMQQPVTVSTGAASTPSRRTPRPASIAPAVAIAPGSEYLTQIGDTLSTIAERVSGRPVGSLWAVAKLIHAQNPKAFRNDDPDRLIAGVTIAIPAVDSLAGNGLGARTTSAAHAHAQPAREQEEVASLPPFVLSTSLSQDSVDRVQLRRGAPLVANPQPTSIAGLPVETQPEEPVTVQTDAPVTTAGATDEATSEAVASGEFAQSGDDDVAERDVQPAPDAAPALSNVEDTAVVDASAPAAASEPVATASPVADAIPSGSQSQTDTATQGSSIRWALWVLGTLIVGAVLGGVLTGLFQLKRRITARRQAESQRRASGRERTIRLDHGIVVKEHPAGTPLTVDASTTEIAAIRLAQPKLATMRGAQGGASAVGVEAHPRLLEFATEAPTDVTLEMASPIAALDLELPEVSESPFDSSEMRTEVIEAPTERSPLADSRQFLVDTDLLALAYKDHDGPEPAELPVTILAELPMFPPFQEATTRDAVSSVIEAADVDDSPLAFWETKEDEDNMPNTAVAVAGAKKKKR